MPPEACEVCEVCGLPGHGNHFGVVSCRACAAFFRRAADSKYEKMGCLSRHCDGKRYLCKACRLKKCREVGMITDKFQHNRDSIIASRKQKQNQISIQRPQIVLFCNENRLETGTRKTFINVTHLIEKVTGILRTGCESPWIGCHLKMLTFGCMQIDKIPTVFEKISEIEVSDIWEFYVLSTARWFTYFQPFQKLEESLKIQLVLATWHVWNRLHKIIATALHRTRNKNAKDDERVLANGVITEDLVNQADIRWLSEYRVDQILYFLDGIHVRDVFPVLNGFGKMTFSKTELTFMVAQLCFQYAADRFGGRIAEIMDKFQEILANDLHFHYTNDMEKPRYSERLVKMMKVNNAIREHIREQRFRAEIARTFRIFTVDFSHPEMFQDTGLT